MLANKANYLAQLGYEIIIVTTEQKMKLPFFSFYHSIRFVDLDINYSDDSKKGFFSKSVNFLIRKQEHKRKMKQLLFDIRPDIVVSMFGNEASFLCNICDGSKKILEIHFSKFFRLQYDRKGMWRLVDLFRSKMDEVMIRRFERFIVLTDEDRLYWGKCENIDVIPNATVPVTDKLAFLDNKEAIALGRLSYQKGYDRLIDAWDIVCKKAPLWKLKIYGSGELYESLEQQIERLNLNNHVSICSPVSNVESVYLNSSLLVLSSRYEGLPMVLLEAMVCGLPVVAYTCKCGPRDVITNGIDGILIEEGNVEKLAEGILSVILDDEKRKKMGINAVKKANLYSEDIVMAKWISLFNRLA